MELVHAQVPELRGLLTQSFEEFAGATGATRASCAISGGATALIFLPALRAANVDWSRITLFWTDERAVPASDPESNYGVAERMLLSPLGARAPRAVRMPADLPSLEDAAARYDATLAKELSGGPLDLAILGAGEDGHVASIFPGQKSNGNHCVIAVENAPRRPRRRLSMSMEFLLESKKIWIVAVGPRKLPALHAALSKTQRSTPLDIVLQHAKDVTVFTDQVIRRR